MAVIPSPWPLASIAVLRAGHSVWHRRNHLGPKWFRSRVSDFDLWYILGGKGRLTGQAQRLTLRRGCLVCFRNGADYDVVQDETDRLSVYYVHFRLCDAAGRRLAAEAVGLPSGRDGVPPYVEPLLARIELLYRLAMEEPRRRDAALTLAAQLLRAVLWEMELGRPLKGASTVWGRPGAAGSELKACLVDYLCANAGRRITVRAMAHDLGYGVDPFIRRMRRETGRTPKSLILELRMQDACRLLTQTCQTVADIALASGYDNSFAFSRQFKRMTGLAPIAFRQRAGGQHP